MSAAQLNALGLTGDARQMLADVVADLAAVEPSTWSAEASAQLAQTEWISDLAVALGHATSSIEAAREWGSPADLCRYLSMRAQLRIMARQATGQRPVLTAEADADLTEAVATPVGTTETVVALIGAHEVRGQAHFFDGDLDSALSALDE